MPDVGEYCRAVEAHLARVNEGHLVRVVGAAFELVREWAQSGVPLSVVRAGIDRKAERHRLGAARRPLRLEFCEPDVRAVFVAWRRAVGVSSLPAGGPAAAAIGEADAGEPSPRRRSLSRFVERAIERTLRAAGRLETPDGLRRMLSESVESLVAIGERTRGARGEAREALVRELALLDRRVLDAARLATTEGDVDRLREQAADDLRAYRRRMAPDAWHRSVDASLDRLIRDRYGLPTLDPEDM
jgi:hypothetical protein